jgi:NhaP-type Na+/H+ or K+/H+ antiporter
MTETISIFAGIGFLTACSLWVAWWVRLPAILFLLLSGLVVGPGLGWLDPDQLLGDLLFPLVSLSVAVILFEGSMTLRFQDLRELGGTVRNLVTIGAAISWAVTSVIVHFVVGFDVKVALLFGAVVVVTGPTVIVPMLRTVRPNANISSVLRWEGIIIDPIGALLAVLAFNFYVSTEAENAYASVAALFVQIVAVGSGLGIAAGFALGSVLKRYLIPDYLRSPMTLLLVFVVFALAENLAHESGLLAVTVFGIALANRKGVEVDDILDFKESLSVLLIGGLFILLAARIEIGGLLQMGWSAFLVLGGVMFVSRPLAVFASSLGSNLTYRERLLIAWIGPRGIVCAAVAAIFAIKLEAINSPGAELFVPLAFLVIIGTVVIQSLTAKPVAHWLGVRDPAPSGFLILGSNRVGRALASALAREKIRVIIADSHWYDLSQARMEGVETYFGNPVSEHADRYLDLSGIGNLLCITGTSNMDVLASLHFRTLTQRTYELPTVGESDRADKHRAAARLRGERLFSAEITYEQFEQWLDGGAEIRATTLTEEFDIAAYRQTYGERFMSLFVVEESGRLRVVTDQAELAADAGTKLISLIKPETEQSAVT